VSEWQPSGGGGGGGVSSFNTRTGAVTLAVSDVEALFTAAGQLLVGTGSGTGELLGIGSANQVLTVNSGGTQIAWATPSSGGVSSFNTRTGAVTLEESDVFALFQNKGGILVGTGSGTGEELAIGASGDVLTVVSGEPAWTAGGIYLGYTQYAPSSAHNYNSLSTTTLTAIDATNLQLAFTAIGSATLLEATGYFSNSSGSDTLTLGWLNNSGGALFGVMGIVSSAAVQQGHFAFRQIVATTAGTSYALNLAALISSAGEIIAQGNTTVTSTGTGAPILLTAASI
jgi:hypothetical protein